MARKLKIEWQEDAEALGKAYRQAKDTQNKQRLQALWLVRQGNSLKATAAIVSIHYRTVQEWIAWYRQGGLKAVLAHRHGGHRVQTRRLSPEQEAELKAKADAGEIRRIEDGVTWAKEKHQVNYSYWGMRHVFNRLKLRRKVPRPQNPKASAREQEAWKKGG